MSLPLGLSYILRNKLPLPCLEGKSLAASILEAKAQKRVENSQHWYMISHSMPSTSLSMPSLKSFFHPFQSLNLQTFNEMGDSHPGMRNEGGELLQKSALFNPFDFTFLSGHSQFQSFWCWWFLSLWKILQWIFGWSSDFLTSSYSFRSVITHLLSFPLSKLYNCYCLSCFPFLVSFKTTCCFSRILGMSRITVGIQVLAFLGLNPIKLQFL